MLCTNRLGARAAACRRVVEPKNAIIVARSASREEALRALENFQGNARTHIAKAAVPYRGSAAVAAASSASTSVTTTDASATAPASLMELTSETYWDFLGGREGQLTIVDFYTDWCGPCKLILPQLVQLSAELAPRGATIVKFNCNNANKDLGKQLGVKVAPTFFLYRGSEKVAEMTGAKVDKLKELIAAQLAA